jgi:hypothetical protein
MAHSVGHFVVLRGWPTMAVPEDSPKAIGEAVSAFIVSLRGA